MLSKCLIMLSAVFSFSAAALQAQVNAKTPQQFNNTVKLATASVHIPHETGNFRPFGQVGIFYERKIAGNWLAGIGYMQWLTVNNGRGYEVPKEGVLAFKDYYKMADIYGLYQHKFYKSHALSAGLGLTYTFGANFYYIEWQNGQAGENLMPYGRNESFWGMVPQMSYSYNFLRNRFWVGADFRMRYYFNNIRPQYEPGAHIGFVF